MHQIVASAAPHVVEMIQAIVGFVGRNEVAACPVMMAIQLIELHRVLIRACLQVQHHALLRCPVWRHGTHLMSRARLERATTCLKGRGSTD